MRRRSGALVIAAIVLAAACGSTQPAAPKLTDSKTLVVDALDDLETATTYHLVMSYSAGVQAAFQVDLHIKLPSEAVGTVTENGATVNVLETGGNVYIQGQDFVSEYAGSMAGKLFGDRWILLTPDLLRTDVLDLAKLTSLPAMFLKFDIGRTRVDHVPAATESTAELESAWGNLFIGELPPHALVKVESASGLVAATGFSDVNFEILEYGQPVDVEAPTDFADPSNPATLPPAYELAGKWSFDRCDQSGCGFRGSVINKGGAYPAASPSTFTFTLVRPNGSFIGRCSGRIPVVANGQSTSIGCRVSGAGWSNFAYYGGSFYGEVDIDNPAYDG